MKRLALLVLLFALPLTLLADELTKKVQTELKELGFFYSDVTGVNGPETVAAIKRYQIRHGLEVTGTLTKETLQALNLASGAAPASPANSAPPAQTRVSPANPPPAPNPPVNLRRDTTLDERDRNFLRQEAAKAPVSRDPSTVPAPAPLTPPPMPGAESYARTFSNTPYESAPVEVQVETLRKAQSLLRRGGYYRASIDGVPGPATEEAVVLYQRRMGLRVTGRFDLETLDAMAMLPGRRNGAPMQRFTMPPGSRSPARPLRGIWID